MYPHTGTSLAQADGGLAAKTVDEDDVVAKPATAGSSTPKAAAPNNMSR
jgi:hypothetical protein